MRIRSRRPKNLRFDLALTAEVELAQFVADGTLRPDLYAWKLSRYLLPIRGFHEPAAARQRIATARAHEAAMWQHYPDGPQSMKGTP